MEKKNKFFTNSCLEMNKQPYYEVNNRENMNVPINNLKNGYNKREKTQMELASKLNPYDYELNWSNRLNKKEEEFTYFAPYNQGPGRGFGDLNIGNSIRVGENGRNDTHNYREWKESELTDRFEFIDKRFANPDNLVFPFPRSGEMTRKVNVYSNAGDFINNYKLTTPNLIKKEIFGNFQPVESFDYNALNEEPLPNQGLIDNINQNNEIHKERQYRASENKKQYEKQFTELGNKLKLDFEKQMAIQKSQEKETFTY
jgi:hypothetical protein